MSWNATSKRRRTNCEQCPSPRTRQWLRRTSCPIVATGLWRAHADPFCSCRRSEATCASNVATGRSINANFPTGPAVESTRILAKAKLRITPARGWVAPGSPGSATALTLSSWMATRRLRHLSDCITSGNNACRLSHNSCQTFPNTSSQCKASIARRMACAGSRMAKRMLGISHEPPRTLPAVPWQRHLRTSMASSLARALLVPRHTPEDVVPNALGLDQAGCRTRS